MLIRGSTRLFLSLLLVGAFAFSAKAITPLSSSSNTQQSTTSTTLVNSDVVIPAASLQNGVQYLIMYSGAYGGTNANAVPEVVVSYGATIIARAADEGSAEGTPEAM
ncbi:MAG TPA: hypothetical protein VHP63_00955, partial [candidate division Zixibacteria bacterium]|nr:hypothetical protein [candidate division Zixibacteria bacterium]